MDSIDENKIKNINEKRIAHWNIVNQFFNKKLNRRMAENKKVENLF